MNIERLMIDLDVSQLEGIQKDLSKETNAKKEELRQMVGRRYRDVLDASNTLKLLTDISNSFCNKLIETKTYFQEEKLPHSNKFIYNDNKVKSAMFSSKFLSFNSLISKMSSKDGLSNVYLVLLLEKIHNDLINYNSSIISDDIKRILQEYKVKLENERENMFSKLYEDLGDNQNVKMCCNQLLAIGFLKKTSLEEYKQYYCDAKIVAIKEKILSGENISNIIKKIRNALDGFVSIFGIDGLFYSITTNVKNPNWKPKIVNEIMNDQVYSISQYFESLIIEINNSFEAVSIKEVVTDNLKNEFENFIHKLSIEIKPLLSESCKTFYDSESIVDFLYSMVETFTNNFPKFSSYRYIYKTLFGNILQLRFHDVINDELQKSSKLFLERTKEINLKPQNIFAKWKAKFDELVTAGVSHELNEVIEEFFVRIQVIQNNVIKYSTIEVDENSHDIYDVFSLNILKMIKYICEYFIYVDGEEVDMYFVPEYSSKSDIDIWLDKFRILLAIIQHEPPTLSECMGDNFQRIRECNNIVVKSTEFCLCVFLNHLVTHIENEGDLSIMINRIKSPMDWLEGLQKYETISLGEAGNFKIPVALNLYIYKFLNRIISSINEKGFGYLLTRKATNHLNKIIGDILCNRMSKCIDESSTSMTIQVQLLLDCRILFSMFLNETFLTLISKIESKINPIDLEIISEPITKNAGLFIQKTYMLFGLLQIEQTQGKEMMKPALTQNNIIELYPRFEDVAFLPSLPRYTKSKKDNSRLRDTDHNEQTLVSGMQGAKVVDSLNSMYEKFSPNTFLL
uniref:Conserved oligomeric Golgi complex subunit 1 n=1 Tax=Parastrongyloides trichosuri TaxID=131310 RepID=A0A0N4ZP03_PARTI